MLVFSSRILFNTLAMISLSSVCISCVLTKNQPNTETTDLTQPNKCMLISDSLDIISSNQFSRGDSSKSQVDTTQAIIVQPTPIVVVPCYGTIPAPMPNL